MYKDDDSSDFTFIEILSISMSTLVHRFNVDRLIHIKIAFISRAHTLLWPLNDYFSINQRLSKCVVSQLGKWWIILKEVITIR